MDEKALRERAEKRVEEKNGFYWNLGAYIVVNAGLVSIWFFTGAGYPWFVWPIIGWGIGLVFHFLGVFILNQGTMYERQVEKEMETLRRKNK